MQITSARFIKGVVGTDEILGNGIPQVAFIGRSNVGKSSVINSLVHKKNLARASAFPGRTQELNVFLINEALYFVDLPGYGFAKASLKERDWLQKVINWYLFKSDYEQRLVVFIIDAKVGLTDIDTETILALESKQKNVIIVANKIDKIKKTEFEKQLQKIQELVGPHKILPYSAKMKIGVADLIEEIFKA